MKIKSIWVDLSLFDGGADGGAEGAEGTPAGEVSNESAAETQSGESNTSDADSQPTEEERAKAYQQFKKDYKDLYAKDFQETFNRRFKDVKNLESQLSEYTPLMDMLRERYDVSDVKSAIKALENDNAYWEQAAYDAGMSVEQYKEVSKLKRENRAFQEQMEFVQNQQRAIQTRQAWEAEAESLRAQYPDLDVNAEIANPQFESLLVSLTRAGFENPMQIAYETCHADEVKAAIASHVAQQTEKKVTDNIKAKGSRPVENGASSSNAFSQKVDVSKLTDKEMDEYIKRASRGETISF